MKSRSQPHESLKHQQIPKIKLIQNNYQKIKIQQVPQGDLPISSNFPVQTPWFYLEHPTGVWKQTPGGLLSETLVLRLSSWSDLGHIQLMILGDIFWLVVDLPLWKIMDFVSWDDDIPNIWKNKKCSKPPPKFFLIQLPGGSVPKFQNLSDFSGNGRACERFHETWWPRP